ncbi:MAG: hypothetical protein WBG32_19280 [Nodosilinea sp.]
MPPISRWIMPLPLAIAFVAPAIANPTAPPRRAEPVSYFCYMVTTDGQVRDLSSLCGDASDTPPGQTVVQNSEPCYFLDSDGKPCQVAGRTASRN